MSTSTMFRLYSSFRRRHGKEWSDTHVAWDLQSGLVHVRGFADPSALVTSYQIMSCEDVATEDKQSEASMGRPSYFGWLLQATASLPVSSFYHWVPPTDSCWIPHFAHLTSSILCTYPWSRQTACLRPKQMRLASCSPLSPPTIRHSNLL
jgi:hypothetical protein